MLASEEQARGRRLIVWITCVASSPAQIFAGSVLLLFLTSLSMDRVGTMVCLSLPVLVAALFMTLQGAGASLGGVLPASAIRLGMFRETWSLGGVARSDYDALLLICGTLVVVVAVTLGLVPSVTGRPQGPARE